MLKRVISVFLCAVLLLNLVYPGGVLAATTADTEILVEDFETTELNLPSALKAISLPPAEEYQ